jgi:hypothetical protein
LAITNLTLGGNYCMPQIAYWGLQQQFCQPTPGIWRGKYVPFGKSIKNEIFGLPTKTMW